MPSSSHITSWVFIWQAITVLFLTPSDMINISTKLLLKINSISFLDKNENILSKEDNKDITKAFAGELNKSNYKYNILLILSTLITAISFYTVIIDGTCIVKDYNIMSNKVFVFNIFSICSNTLIALTGISGIIDYKENKGISKLTKIFIFASGLILLGLIIVEILVKMFSYMTPNIISLIVVLIGILIKKVKI